MSLHPTIAAALAPFAPPPVTECFGVIHDQSGWWVYWNGQMDERAYPTRTAAIDELRKRDRAANFCEEA